MYFPVLGPFLASWSPALAPNLYLPALAPNLYLLDLAHIIYLPALAPNLCLTLVQNLHLPALVYNTITSAGPEFCIY